MVKIRQKSTDTIQAGIWQRGEKLEIVWFDEKNQPHFLYTDIQHPLVIPKKIAEQKQINLSNALKFKFITAISENMIITSTS